MQPAVRTSTSRILRTRHAICLCLLLTGLAAANERITPIDADALGANLAGREGRVVLVNFWATWCRPCLDEIPALVELERKLGEQGFDLVAVSLDNPADQQTLLEPFLIKWFPGFTTYLSVENDMDSMVSVVDPFWDEVLPTSYVLARDGSMVKRFQGGSSAEEFAAAIQPLLD
jgi:thiol-disulfide isomerase/thioredoxin